MTKGSWQISTQAWSHKWEKKKSEAPFETIKEEGSWTSNLTYKRQGWTWAGLQHLIRNGAGWLYPRRSSEAKKKNGGHILRNRVGLPALGSEISTWQFRHPATETLQRDVQDSKTTGRTITKQNSRLRKVSKPNNDVRKELNLAHTIKQAVTSHFVGPVSFPVFQHFLSSGIWYQKIWLIQEFQVENNCSWCCCISKNMCY